MRPKRIILIRHGESSANVDRYLFGQIPDYTIELTEKGCMQARVAGCKLKELVGDESIYFYVSPFWRTRSTFENIVRSIPRSQFVYSEEPRLREQEWGYLRCNEDFDKMMKVNLYSAFYTTQETVRYMLREHEGCIINISSIYALTGGSCEVHYSMAKAAIDGMTKALAKEVRILPQA